MERRILGNTGIEVSPITVGTWQLGGPLFFAGKPDGHPDPGKENVVRMIREVGDLGINAIDTAEQYSAGESERRVGEALRGHRDDWVISTKFGYRVTPDGEREDDSSPGTILPSLEGSLRRLGTDFIDLYLYHCAPDTADIDAGREVLERARQEGKIRCFGISTGDSSMLAEMAARDAVEVAQFPTSLLEPNEALWQIARDQKLGTQLRGVMAMGRLSGKYFERRPDFSADDNRSDWCAGEDFTRYAPLADCLPGGVTMAQAAVRWVLDRAGAHTVCMGAKRVEDYRGAIAAVEMQALGAEVEAALESKAAEILADVLRSKPARFSG